MLLIILYNFNRVLQPFDRARFQPGFARRFYQPGKVELPCDCIYLAAYFRYFREKGNSEYPAFLDSHFRGNDGERAEMAV